MDLPKAWIPWIWIALAIVATILVFVSPGTGDGGDSIQHYLTARYAFRYPQFFFDLWAKPVFMVFAAPLSQLGFRALMLGNVWLGLLSAWLVYRCAEHLHIQGSAWGILFLFSVAGYVPLLYSGLTEPLFAFLLILAFYAVLRKKLVLALIVVSLLPFTRNEGWVIVFIYAIWVLLESNWKQLGYLLLGPVLISLLGWPFQGRWNWIFTKIPDIGGQLSYGEGSFWHFFDKLNYVIGIPLYILLALGGLAMIISIFRLRERKKTPHWFAFLWLVFGSFSAFFLVHSLAWWLPGLKSMGLERVLASIIPIGILIVLYGWQWFSEHFPGKWRPWLQAIIAAYVLLFPFLPNPAAYDWERDWQLTPDQTIAPEIVSFAQHQYPEAAWYHEHPYLNFLGQRDPFDPEQGGRLLGQTDFASLAKGSLIIWDSWFAVVEGQQSLENLRNQPLLKEVRVSRYPSERIYSEMVVFVRK